MPNALLTPTAVTREALRVLHQKLNFVGSIVREYDDSFAQKGAKIGDTLKVRLPNQYVVRTGATLAAQDTNEASVELKVQTQRGVDLNFTSVDLTLSLDDFSKRILDPAMSTLAASIEADAMSMYRDVFQSVWNGGAAITLEKVLDGRVLLQNALAPLNDRTANLNTTDNAKFVDALKALFNDTSGIAKQYREGYMGRTAGFDFVENTMWGKHTRGAANASYTTSTLVGVLPISENPVSTMTVATGTGAMNVGDVFTIGNVFAVHPETKANTGTPQQFVVTAAYAGGAGSVSFSPAIVLSGGRQNVVIPTTSATAAITFAGTASTAVGISLLYQKEAFAFATADLVMPGGVDFAAREVMDGISMRVVRQYDINNDKFPTRLDVLYGYKTLRPQLAARLHNS
ncbi:MAG: P22 phage major capsid protein family protein [Phycisphaerales bacterium]